jgi:hypothetical protein
MNKVIIYVLLLKQITILQINSIISQYLINFKLLLFLTSITILILICLLNLNVILLTSLLIVQVIHYEVSNLLKLSCELCQSLCHNLPTK